MSEPKCSLVLTVYNAHSDQCGRPPAVLDDGTGQTYVGFFTNTFGEQWVVQIDRQKKTGTLRGGDIGWEREIRIADNKIQFGLIIAPEEFHWLAACWKAATGQQLQPRPKLKLPKLLAQPS